MLHRISALLALALSGTIAFAQGTLVPVTAPAPTMKSLQEIWDKIGALEVQNLILQQRLMALQQQNALLLEHAGISLPWQISTLDSSGSVGEYTSLGFAAGASPAIAYYDYSNGDLKFAVFNGSAWQLSLVDSGGGVGRYASLAFTSNGRAAISYYDYTNGDLKFAVFNGSAWDRTTVDSTGDVGTDTSLAFTQGGQPAISYCDNGNRRLKSLCIMALLGRSARWIALEKSDISHRSLFRPEGNQRSATTVLPIMI